MEISSQHNVLFTGLRTLCFAVAAIPDSVYEEWLDVFHRASISVQNRALKLEECYELIEKVSGVMYSFTCSDILALFACLGLFTQ